MIEPRDYFYKTNRNQFSNLIAISTSGNTNGIKDVLDDFNGTKFLITQNKELKDKISRLGFELTNYKKEYALK